MGKIMLSIIINKLSVLIIFIVDLPVICMQ